MGTPIDRANKNALDANLHNGITSDAPKVKANNDTLYNYADYLNSQDEAHASAAILAHPDGSVVTSKLANSGVTTPKLADNAVTTSKIANGAVTAAKLATDATVNESINNALIRALRKDFEAIAFTSLSDFNPKGDGISNDTAAFVNAFAEASISGKTLKIPRAEVKYKIDPILVPSNLHVIFEKETIIEINSGIAVDQRMFSFDGASNVIWECNGAIFQMLKEEYTTDERRHAFNLINCENITLIEPIAKNTGGDGFFIGGVNNNIKLIRPISDNARRNGISVVSANNLLIENPICKNTNGTDPQSGIDIEPNSVSDVFNNVKIVNPLCEGNAKNGLQLYFFKYGQSSPSPDIYIDVLNPITRNNGNNGISLSRLETMTYMNGYINIINPLSENDGYSGLIVRDKSIDFSFVNIVNPTVVNPCRNKTTYPTDRGVALIRENIVNVGRMKVAGISVTDANTQSEHGVTVMLGATEETYIEVKSVKGYISASVGIPVTMGEIVSDTVTIDVRDVHNERAFMNATLSIYGNQFGNVLTNEGATTQTSLQLREHLPIGHCYRFKVKSAQPFRVLPFITGETILGANGPNKYIESSVIGSEMDLYYQGNGLWVPQIRSGSWTFQP